MRRSVTELGQSIVMVTHDPYGAAYADRVIFLADGAVAGAGPPDRGLGPGTDADAGRMTCAR